MGLFGLAVSGQATAPRSDIAAQGGVAPHDQAERTTERFRQECRAAGVKSFEAVIDESEKASSLVRHGHCNDLTLLTNADPAAPDRRLTQNFVEHIVLHTARPTVILPCAGRFDTIGTIGANVLVAWNDSREPRVRCRMRCRSFAWPNTFKSRSGTKEAPMTTRPCACASMHCTSG